MTRAHIAGVIAIAGAMAWSVGLSVGLKIGAAVVAAAPVPTSPPAIARRTP
jgi:hypothetical protein